MQLTVTQNAVDWFKRDWRFQPGDEIRIFIRYGGGGTSFSLGLRKERARNIGLSTKTSDVVFYLDEEDVWYLENRDLTIDYDDNQDDILYIFTQQAPVSHSRSPQ